MKGFKQFEIYQASPGKPERVGQAIRNPWYWRLVGRNNRIVSVGGEGFFSPANAKRSVKRHNDLFREPLPVKVLER